MDDFEETTPNEQPDDFNADNDVVDSSAEELGGETVVGDAMTAEPPLQPEAEPTIRQSAVVPETDPEPQATTARPSIYDEPVEESSGLPILPIAIGGVAALCGLVLIAGMIALLVVPGLRGGSAAGSDAPDDGPTPTLERTLVFPTATIGPTEAMVETEEVEEEPEEEEAPEDEPTATNQPAPTNPPAQPTNPPPPPAPTDTPPPPPPPAFDIPGLTGVSFSVPNPVVAANQRIDFNFSVTNEGTDSIIFGPLGVAIQDANGTTLAFHTSWTRWELEPEKTENWADGVTIGDPGSYRLELSACIPYNDDHCDASGGDWHVLAPAISVTVN